MDLEHVVGGITHSGGDLVPAHEGEVPHLKDGLVLGIVHLGDDALYLVLQPYQLINLLADVLLQVHELEGRPLDGGEYRGGALRQIADDGGTIAVVRFQRFQLLFLVPYLPVLYECL